MTGRRGTPGSGGWRTMAQQALTAGTTVPRKRAMFGLLDADGWAWASVKADRLAGRHHHDARLHPGPGVLLHGLARRSTSASSSGRRSTSARRRTRRCRARHRSARSSPGRRRRTAARRCPRHARTAPSSRSAPGSSTSAAATARPRKIDGLRRARRSGTGNFDKWAPGPPLPEPRTDLSISVRRRQRLRRSGARTPTASRRPRLRLDPGQHDR